MKNLLFALSLLLVCSCKKSNDPATHMLSPIDSIVGTYHGNMNYHTDWYFPNATGVDSGRYDTTYLATFTIKKLTANSVSAGFENDSGGYKEYAYDVATHMCSTGDPHHGGAYFNLYPARDSIYFYSQHYGGGSMSYSNKVSIYSGKK